MSNDLIKLPIMLFGRPMGYGFYLLELGDPNHFAVMHNGSWIGSIWDQSNALWTVVDYLESLHQGKLRDRTS